MKLVNNIDVIRIPLTGENLLYLPKNTNLIGKRINNIYATEVVGEDPYNGATIDASVADTYLTLIDTNGNTVVDNIDLAYFVKNQATAININAAIDFESSYINRRNYQLVPGQKFELLLYVTYDNTIVSNEFRYSNAKTLFIPMNYRGSLERFINSDNFGKVVKIDIPEYKNVWLNLYDKNGKNFDSCVSALFQEDVNYGNGWEQNLSVNNPILLNHLLVDWQRSEIINPNNNIVKLIIYFAQ